jgi:DNA-binding XRE family transcriptional regulator
MPTKSWTRADIRALRNALGDSQSAFAKRLGVSLSLVISWERPEQIGGLPNPHYREPSALAKFAFERLKNERKKRVAKK